MKKILCAFSLVGLFFFNGCGGESGGSSQDVIMGDDLLATPGTMQADAGSPMMDPEPEPELQPQTMPGLRYAYAVPADPNYPTAWVSVQATMAVVENATDNCGRLVSNALMDYVPATVCPQVRADCAVWHSARWLWWRTQLR